MKKGDCVVSDPECQISTLEEQQYSASGLPLPLASKLTQDAAFTTRFWIKTTRDVAGEKECWEWTAAKEEHGYGVFKLSHDGRQIVAHSHRVAYMLGNGTWPSPSKMVLHSCDNRACCNPAHLREGTAQENQDDIDARGRRRNGTESWRNGTPSESMLRGKSKIDPSSVRRIRRIVDESGGVQQAVDSGALLMPALELDTNVAHVKHIASGNLFAWVAGKEDQ